jgi:polysaccharide biosynthesis/export protein
VSRTMLQFLVLISLCFLACGAQPPFVWYSSLGTESKLPERTVISPGDRIFVQIEQHPELSGEFLVGMSGEYNQPIAGLTSVAGSTALKAAEIIKIKLGRFYQDPRVSVTLLAYRTIHVTVLGEVESAGRYEMANGSSVITALGSAGGLNEFASADGIYVLRASNSGQRIRFRYADLTKPDPAALNFELRDGDAVLVE